MRSTLKKSFTQDRTTLWHGAKLYVVYLRSRGLSPQMLAAHLRVVRHILKFYGYHFKLREFTGSRVLQYADIYDPWNSNELIRERGQFFWPFVHWLKKNEMIPGFTAKEP